MKFFYTEWSFLRRKFKFTTFIVSYKSMPKVISILYDDKTSNQLYIKKQSCVSKNIYNSRTAQQI